MTVVTTALPWSGTRGIVSRGVLAGGAIGMTTGGLAGTAEWPVVGTFFAAIAGAIVGVLTGACVGTTLSVRPERSSPTTQRIVGTSTAAAAFAVGALVHLAPTVNQVGIVAALVLIAVTGLASPIIASGLPAARVRGRWLPSALAWTAVLGTGIGAGVGALVGFGIGLTELPLVLAATVECAILGGVSGCVLALLVCAGLIVKASLHPTRTTMR